MSIFGFFKQADINAGVQEFLKTEKAVLLDVRTKEEYESGHIENSENIPLQQIQKVLDKITDKNTPLFVYCQSGARVFIVSWNLVREDSGALSEQVQTE